eukprot:5972709-Pyramimonas_sp.AAC.1
MRSRGLLTAREISIGSATARFTIDFWSARATHTVAAVLESLAGSAICAVGSAGHRRLLPARDERAGGSRLTTASA